VVGWVWQDVVLEGGLKNDSMEVSEKVKMAKVREVAVDWDLDK